VTDNTRACRGVVRLGADAAWRRTAPSARACRAVARQRRHWFKYRLTWAFTYACNLLVDPQAHCAPPLDTACALIFAPPSISRSLYHSAWYRQPRATRHQAISWAACPRRRDATRTISFSLDPTRHHYSQSRAAKQPQTATWRAFGGKDAGRDGRATPTTYAFPFPATAHTFTTSRPLPPHLPPCPLPPPYRYGEVPARRLLSY